MPPDGYESVSLPEDVVEDLDGMAQALGCDSRADAVRMLLEDYDPRVSAYVVEIDSGVVDDIAGRVGKKAANEVEARLR